MTLPDTAFLKKSVTAGNLSAYQGNGVINVMVPLDGFGMWGVDQIALPPQPPPYWSYMRDDVLRATVYKEAMWGASIGIAISKIAAAGWEIKSESKRKAKNSQDLYLFADGRSVGWVSFLGKHLRAYLTSDNGAFVEIIRASKGVGSKIIGLRHLASRRCQRTGDPAIPVLYRDLKGKRHELKDYQVMCFADMPDDDETFFGTGLCAASRAYAAIFKLASIEWFVREKVSGLHPLAIHIVNGVLSNQLDGAVKAAKDQTISKGIAAYMGAVIIGIPQGEAPAVVTIPLAELPDGFNRKEEFDLSILTYANSIGLDVQDLQPLSGQGLGSGTQSLVLSDKGKGKGLASWKQQWIHQNNEKVLPAATTFEFIEKDYEDMTKRASVSKSRAEVAKLRIEAAITTPAQELQVMVDEDELPREFLALDLTEGENLSDTEKPVSEGAQAEQAAEMPTPEQVELEETKEQREAILMLPILHDEYERAKKLYKKYAGADE